MKAYSYDLRFRSILNYNITKSLRITSKLFSIGKSTLHRWYKDYSIKNNFIPKKRICIQYKLNDEIKNFIFDQINDKVFITLKELKFKIINKFKLNISTMTIHRVIKKNNYSRKKIYPIIDYKNKCDFSNIENHKEKMIKLMKTHNIISIDETHIYNNMIPRYGRSKKGCKIEYKVNNIYNKKMCSCIMAISNKKIIYYQLLKGSIKSDEFIGFLSNLKNKINIENEK